MDARHVTGCLRRCQSESHSSSGGGRAGLQRSPSLATLKHRSRVRSRSAATPVGSVGSPGKETRLPKLAASFVVLSVTLLGLTTGFPADMPAEVIVRDVEYAFRDVMELWAYREFWRLWDVCTSQSRYYMSQNEFADVMERGTARPATGRRIEDLQISATSPQTAVVLARIGLEDPGTNTTRSLVRSFLFYYEDDRWRPQLSDFLGLSSYFFPPQPYAGPGIFFAPCCRVPIAPPKPPAMKPVAPCCSARPPSTGAQIVPRR